MITEEQIEARVKPYWSEAPVFRAVDVHPGWYGLIDQLITDLEVVGGVPPIVQIKTKFGGLRFYTEAATEEQRALINAAETASATTCERCGAPGEAKSINGWWWTLCEPCVPLLIEERNKRWTNTDEEEND